MGLHLYTLTLTSRILSDACQKKSATSRDTSSALVVASNSGVAASASSMHTRAEVTGHHMECTRFNLDHSHMPAVAQQW